jgi:hypothetical protein
VSRAGDRARRAPAPECLARAGALALALAALGCGGEASPRAEPCRPPGAVGELGTLCGFARPEDVELAPEAGVVLVSEQGWDAPEGGGAISAVVLPSSGAFEPPLRLWPNGGAAAGQVGGRRFGAASCAPPTAPDRFSPHGLASRPLSGGGRLVAVVRHGEREAVELFELTGQGRAAALGWVGCVALPEDAAGNDVAFTPSGELVVTNYVPTLSGLRTLYWHLRAALGRDSGDLIVWSEGEGWRHVPHSGAAMPNGVAVSADGSFAYFAASGEASLRRVRLDGSGARETLASFDGVPDNLAWGPSGALWVSLLHASPHGRGLCRRYPLPGCPAAWSLVEWDPRAGRTTELVRTDGGAVHSVTSAAAAGPWRIFGSMAEDRIGIARAGP